MKAVNAIPGLSVVEMERLQSIFATADPFDQVILYGSRAKGTHRPASDIDLTIKGGALTTEDLLDLSAEIDDLLLPYEVDLSLFAQIDNPELLGHIQRNGKVVFDNAQ